MPTYKTLTLPPSIAPGDSYQVSNAETLTPGAVTGATERVALCSSPGLPSGVRASGFFSATPGTLELDVQASDVDVDAQYQTLPNGTITSVDSTNFTWNFEDSACNFRFVRLLVRSRQNSVALTADISR